MEESLESEFFHADGQTGRYDDANSRFFLNFGIAPKIYVFLPICTQVNTQKELNGFVENLMLDNFYEIVSNLLKFGLGKHFT